MPDTSLVPAPLRVRTLAVCAACFLAGAGLGFAQIADLIRNNISLPEDVDAGNAKPADIDGDGDIDFVIQDFAIVPGRSFGHRIAWARNDGGEDWAVLPISNAEETYLDFPFEVADMDNDGDLDVVTGSFGQSFTTTGWDLGRGAALRVHTNNGQGSFTQTTILETNFFNQSFTGAKFIVGVATADLDRDRDLDIIILQGSSVSRIAWIPNNGDGTYGGVQVIWQEDGLNPSGVATGDVDGDGDIDVVVSTFPRRIDRLGEIICMKNPLRGGGQWQRTVVPETSWLGAGKEIFLADMDNDSNLDIAGLSATSNPRFGYHRGDGRGNFTGAFGLNPNTLWSLPAAGRLQGFHVVDFDGDGDLDWFMGRPSSNNVLYREMEGGQLSRMLSLTLSRMDEPFGCGVETRCSGTGLFTADVNGDGRLDLVTHGAVMTWWDLVPDEVPPDTVDTDSDGITDALELELGTDPNNAGDRPIETGGSIGINFVSARDSTGVILPGERAGYPEVAQTNWNNTDGETSGNNLNFLREGITLIDSDGQDSRAIVTWDASDSYFSSNGNGSGDSKLMNGYLDNVGPEGFATVDILNITYANYDVYVYMGADMNGRLGAIESTTAGQTFSYATFSQFSDIEGAFPDFYTMTANQGTGHPLANYCVFRNQSSGSFSVRINRGINNSGIHGIQIVPTNPELIEGAGSSPANAIPLGVLGDRETIVAFNTFESLIDTEMALFTSGGVLAAENNDAEETLQSSFAYSGLLPGTWYLAVGAFDTGFADGFSATGGPSGGIFTLNVGPSGENLRARIPEAGATWFSFEMRPNPLGLPPERPVRLGILGDGSLPLTFSTVGSTIDTEMALYGPEGNLLLENDDFGGTRQSLISARNLAEGTYYVAVGQYDTVFRDGFSVEASPEGASFVLRVGTGQPIAGSLPEDGIRWFTFDVAPSPPPEVSVASVWLSDGNVNMSWQTTAGMRYRVQRSSDLETWQNVGSLRTGTGNPLQHSQAASNDREFFRVVIP